ncbi:hypothetical protein L484_026519 [Morus notabilis]|uniref:Uncharacterized protein n=1 Tax=Morus notabilis TaxID=981085 RepID=W9QP44_9ROSA|nr:hypothetical protein L484_026519 [Morus notabilis]
MASDGKEKVPSETNELNFQPRQENERRADDEYDNIEAQKNTNYPQQETTEPQESSFRKCFRKYKASGPTMKEALDKQDMPKHAIAWGVAIGTAIAVMYQKDPKPMTGFMEVVAWFLPLSVTALFIGILWRRPFPRFAFIATLVGYTLIFGSLFCLFSFFLKGQFTAFIPMACWVIIVLVLFPAFIHGLSA